MITRKQILGAFASIIFAFNANANHLEDHLLISARMNGGAEVPSVTTDAQGVLSATLNATRDTLCLKINVTGLSGPITGIHLHEGEPGTNGGVFKDLTPHINGNKISVTLVGADVSAANISKYLSGKLYVNLHTAANPNGEIRGQLNLETDWSFSADLNGAQSVPAVTTTAFGVGSFNLSKDLSRLDYNIVCSGLSGAITASHIHFGAAGTTGGVASALTVNGNVISGSISAPSQMIIDSLLASSIYINVHTAANPNGEIRAQLSNSSDYIYFDSSVDGAQEVPSVTTTALGSSTIKMNTTLDTLWYDVAATGLSGAITGAHFHNAEFGVNGGVEVALNVTGNRVQGMVTGATLTSTLVNKFLTGDIYINMHTATNPNGEIRGQVYRLAREGYTFDMEGSQEVPGVTTSAVGGGMVSIDRNQDNAHIMLVSSGLTSTGIHFHNAAAGSNGGVIFNMTSLYNNDGVFTYWRSSDVIPFTTAESVMFRDNEVYVNNHTAANPNGEIRGQVLRGFACAGITTNVEILELEKGKLNVYPNPATSTLNLDLNIKNGSKGNITIIDALGKTVYTNVMALNSGNNFKSINISSLKQGLYFVKILTEDDQIVSRFIKE